MPHLDAAATPRSAPAPPADLEAEALADGIAHHRAGRYAAAAACYAALLDARPACAPAWRLLGVVALQTGDHVSARRLLATALDYDVRDPATHAALGQLAETTGDLAGAFQAYGTAWRLDPADGAAAAGLARTQLRLGEAATARATAERALASAPHDAALLRALGAARLATFDRRGALDACLASLAIEPHADAYANAGAAYVHLRRDAEAVAACEAALARAPGHADAANTLGIALKAQGALEAACAAFERSAALGCAAAEINRGTTLLLAGDYPAGWAAYGAPTPERRTNPLAAALPLWDGAPLGGRRILIWPEQGVGDLIQMARFLPSVRAAGGRVTLAAPVECVDLFRTCAGVEAVIDAGVAPVPADYDTWLPAIRLAGIFDARPQTLPRAPYLHADPARIERLRPLLAACGWARRVGVAWSGNPRFAWNDIRSCGIAALDGLARVADVSFVALQQGPARDERSRLPLVPVNRQVRDFADTAALITLLDAVVTVDTSVAHLAGALGRPAFVLLSNRPDWRWGRSGAGTPWYPSLRLLRQDDSGEWRSVVDAAAAALAGMRV